MNELRSLDEIRRDLAAETDRTLSGLELDVIRARLVDDVEALVFASEAAAATVRAEALREAADEVHIEARWQQEQSQMFVPGSSAPAEHERARDRFLMVERILRDRAAAVASANGGNEDE